MRHMTAARGGKMAEILREGGLWRRGGWEAVAPGEGATAAQADGSVVRLSFAVHHFEYLRGEFETRGAEVCGGRIAGFGPPRAPGAPYLARGEGRGPKPPQGEDSRGGAGLVWRTRRGSRRAAVYLGPGGGADTALLQVLLAGPPPPPGADADRPGVPDPLGGPAPPSGGASSYERRVAGALRAAGLEYETQGAVPHPLPGGRPFRLDFRVLSLGVVLEVDGEFHFPGPGRERPAVERDVYKALVVEAGGERVLRISYRGVPEFCGIRDLGAYLRGLPRGGGPAYLPDDPSYAEHRAQYARARADLCAWMVGALPAMCPPAPAPPGAPAGGRLPQSPLRAPDAPDAAGAPAGGGREAGGREPCCAVS